MRSVRLLKWGAGVTWTVVFVGGRSLNEGRLPWRRPLAVIEFVLGLNENGNEW